MRRHRHRKRNAWSFKVHVETNRRRGERSNVAGYSVWDRSVLDHVCDKMTALSAPSEQMRLYYGSAFTAEDYRAGN